MIQNIIDRSAARAQDYAREEGGRVSDILSKLCVIVTLLHAAGSNYIYLFQEVGF